MYLVDTNVISAGAPTKAQPAPDLAGWMERNSERLYLSAITVAEVEDGTAKPRRTRATRKADRLAEWLDVYPGDCDRLIRPMAITQSSDRDHFRMVAVGRCCWRL